MKRKVLGYYVEVFDNTNGVYILQSKVFKTYKQAENFCFIIDYIRTAKYGVSIMILEGFDMDNYDINTYKTF